MDRDQEVTKSNLINTYRRIQDLASKYTDLKVICHDEETNVFKCHRLILASGSHYFENIFDEENHVEELRLTPLIDAATFTEVLRYMYHGNVNIHDDNVFNLLRASDILGLTFVERRCVAYLTENNIPMNRALDLFLFVAEKRKDSLLPVISRFILANVNTFSHSTDFLNIPRNYLVRMLSHWPPSSSNEENALLRAVFRWATAHSTEAGGDINAVVAALNINFQHVSAEDIETFSLVRPVNDGNLDIEAPSSSPNIPANLHVYINTHLFYFYYPFNLMEPDYTRPKTYVCTLQKSSTDIDWRTSQIQSVISSMRTVVYESHLYCLKRQGDSYSFSMCPSADLSTATELSMPPMNSSQTSGLYRPRSDHLLCGNKNHIYFYDNFGANLSKYDYHTNTWSQIPVNYLYNILSTPLFIACDDSRLFVMGTGKSRWRGGHRGRYWSAYDPRSGLWQKLENSRLYHTTRDEGCCHKEKLYLTSLKEDQTNYSSFGKTCLRGMDIYDPVAERWSSVPYTPENRKMYRHRLISFNNLLWMVSHGYGEFGGHNDESVFLKSYNSYNEKWDSVELLDSVIVNKIYPSDVRNGTRVNRQLLDIVSFI